MSSKSNNISFIKKLPIENFISDLYPVVVNSDKECNVLIMYLLAVGTAEEQSKEIELSYTPDFNNQINIDFQEIIKTLLFVKFEDKSSFVQNFFSIYCDVYIYPKEQPDDLISTDFYVFNVSTITTLDPLNWLKKNLLTVQPQIRSIDLFHPDFVSYYAMYGGMLKARFYQNSGSSVNTSSVNSEDVLLATFNAEKAATYRIDFYTIWYKSSFPSLNRYGYFDLFFQSSSGEILSYFYRYVFRDKKDDLKYFYFTNSRGGIDSFVCSGPLFFVPGLQYEIAEKNNKLENIPQYYRKRYTQESGLINKEHQLAVFDFLKSEKIYQYHTDKNKFTEIAIEESGLEFSDKNNISSFFFTFYEKEKSDLIEDVQNTNLPIYELATPSLLLNILTINNLSENFSTQFYYDDVHTVIRITSSSAFTITNRNASIWITATPDSGSGTVLVTIAAEENETQAERTAIFDIENEEGNSLTATFTQNYLPIEATYITINDNKLIINNNYITI